MYQFVKSEKAAQNESVQLKRSSRTFATSQNTGSLFDDTLHQRLTQSSASVNKDAHPYLGGSGSDNNAAQLKSVAQMANGANAYDAGSGDDWHIHYGSHIKYRGMDETRVNFLGRKKKKILRELRRIIRANRLEGTVQSQHFHNCMRWIFKYIR